MANPALRLKGSVGQSGIQHIAPQNEIMRMETTENNNVYEALNEHDHIELSWYRKSTYDPKAKTKRSLEYTDGSS